MATFTGIQANTQHTERVHTKTYSPLGITGAEIENKPLPPLLRVVWICRATAIVCITEEVSGQNTGLAVFHETGTECLLGHDHAANTSDHTRGTIEELHRNILYCQLEL